MDFLVQDFFEHRKPKRLKDWNLKFYTSNSTVRKHVMMPEPIFQNDKGGEKIEAKEALQSATGVGVWERTLSHSFPWSSLCRDRERLGPAKRFAGSESRENLCLDLWERSQVFHEEKIWDQSSRNGRWVCLGTWAWKCPRLRFMCVDPREHLNMPWSPKAAWKLLEEG